MGQALGHVGGIQDWALMFVLLLEDISVMSADQLNP
jgi:hypothetical protein